MMEVDGDLKQGHISKALESIASDIVQIEEIVREMHLSVMNAKVFTYRAGNAARGFQPITGYMEQMTHDVSKSCVSLSEGLSVLSGLRAGFEQDSDLFLSGLEGLCADMDLLSEWVQSAPVVVTLARIEAAYAGTHRRSLEGMAEVFDIATQAIRTLVKRSKNKLSELRLSIL